MKQEKAEKGYGLSKEIGELLRYKKFLECREYRNCVHFEIMQHYNPERSSEKIIIDTRHTERLFLLIDQIITELQIELEDL